MASILIEGGVDLDARIDTPEGYNALMIATRHGHKNVARRLIQAGCDLSVKALDYGTTALMHGCGMGQYDIVCMLLDRGADCDAADDVGNTALLVSVMKGYRKIVSKLLESGASINKGDLQGKAPLFRAVDFNFPDLVELLLKSGANVNHRTTDSYFTTPLHRACV